MRPMRPVRILVSLAFLALASLATFAARLVPARPAGFELIQEMSYFVDPSGSWRAKNPAAGRPGQPSEFGYEFTWGLGKNVVTTRILGIFADGRVREIWHYDTVWNARDRVLELHGVASDGRITVGHRVPGTKTTKYTGIDRNGRDYSFLETVQVHDADTFESTTAQGGDSSLLLWERRTLERR